MNLSEPLTMTYTTTMIDNMDEMDYAFFLAYGETQEDEKLNSLLDVEMYNMMCADMYSAVEESHSTVLD